MALMITHTDADGTMLGGTARGDGSAAVVKALGWRWGRSIGPTGSWYVPRSRGVPPQRELIEATAQALGAAGFGVEVRIDATPADRAQAEELRAQASQARAQRLTARARREQGLAQDRWEAGRRLAEAIPFGQPILLGHHSQARAERDRDRIAAHTQASIAHQRAGDAAAAAARTAAGSTSARHNPVTVANRIERLAAAVHSEERLLARSARSSSPEESLQRRRERLEATRADLAHWEQVRARQLTQGVATDYGPGTVATGDAVKIRGQWRRVVRANAKSVSVATDYSRAARTPWHEVQDHRKAGEPGS